MVYRLIRVILGDGQTPPVGNTRFIVNSVSGPGTTSAGGDPDASGVLTETSGLVLSQKNTEERLFYTHNDGDANPYVYVIDDQAGSDIRMTITLSGAGSGNQFEEIAIGPGPDPTKKYVYVGRTGDWTGSRNYYRFEEPTITSTTDGATLTVTPTVFTFTMPSGVADSEGFFVDPISGDLFMFQKRSVSGTRPYTCNVYRVAGIAEMTTSQTVTHTLVGAITAAVDTVNNASFTAADISSNGMYIALCNYQEIFIWNRKPNQTISEMFIETPTAPVRRWYTNDAGVNTTWGTESLAWSAGAQPTRLYGVSEGAGSGLKYVTVGYSEIEDDDGGGGPGPNPTTLVTSPSLTTNTTRVTMA